MLTRVSRVPCVGIWGYQGNWPITINQKAFPNHIRKHFQNISLTCKKTFHKYIYIVFASVFVRGQGNWPISIDHFHCQNPYVSNVSIFSGLLYWMQNRDRCQLLCDKKNSNPTRHLSHRNVWKYFFFRILNKPPPWI